MQDPEELVNPYETEEIENVVSGDVDLPVVVGCRVPVTAPPVESLFQGPFVMNDAQSPLLIHSTIPEMQNNRIALQDRIAE